MSKDKRKGKIVDMNDAEIKQLVERLEGTQGQALSYAKLCDALGLPRKTGEAKEIQLNDLKLICEYNKQSHPCIHRLAHSYHFEYYKLGCL